MKQLFIVLFISLITTGAFAETPECDSTEALQFFDTHLVKKVEVFAGRETNFQLMQNMETFYSAETGLRTCYAVIAFDPNGIYFPVSYSLSKDKEGYMEFALQLDERNTPQVIQEAWYILLRRIENL